ncbi:MAG: response regulator [Planctomycetota bacterium]
MNLLRSLLPSGFLTRLLSFLILTAVGVFALGSYGAWRSARQQVEQEERARLAGIVTALAPYLDGNAHERWCATYPDKDDVVAWGDQPEELQELYRELANAHRANALESPIYTLRVRDGFLDSIRAEPDRIHVGAMEFILTSNARPYWRHRFDYLPQMRTALIDRDATSTEIYTTIRGTWVSAYAPVLDAEGNVVALLEADTPMDTLLARSSARLWTRTGWWAMLFVLVIAAVALISFTMTRELRELERATERFGAGDFDTPVRTSGETREVRSLASTLDAARMRISAEITQRERLNGELDRARVEAEAASEAKSRFLANMSHEIRTPMNGIIGMVELLSSTTLDEDQRDLVQTLDASGEALLTLLNDILDFSKIEAGKLVLESVDLDLRACVEDTVELLSSKSQAKSLETHCFLPEELPPRYVGDPGRLRQVLLNLVGNAIKFTEDGEINVAVSGERCSATAYRLRFEVRDTGIGIVEDDQARLFSPFTQADESTTRRFGGTGLGLAISRQLVELMGGEIGVESTVGEGSTFWFEVELPVLDEAPASFGPRLALLRSKRVLVVDDNATSRQVLGHHLGARGVVCDFAVDGDEGLQMALEAAGSDTPYDAVLTDLLMPGLDGVALGKRLRDEASFSAPIIAISAYGDILRESGDARALFDRVLSKPFRRAQLLRALVELFGDALDSPVAAPPAEVDDEASDGAACRVLIAEDNPVNQKVIERMVLRAGYVPTVVDNGSQAVELIKREAFGIVLMDCQMPEMDGYEATRLIRELEGPKRRTPILGLSAHVIREYRERALEVGMDDYLSKPVRIAALTEALERWCGQDKRAPFER